MGWSLCPGVFCRNARRSWPPRRASLLKTVQNQDPACYRSPPNEVVPWSPLLNRERCTASFQSLDIVNGLLRFGAALVIGIDIGRTNDTTAVDHEPSRHGHRAIVNLRPRFAA